MPDTAPAHERFPNILTPLEIGPATARHRIMVTGHTQLYGHDGVLSERHIAYYRERAMGGAALLILEQQAAHPAGRNYHAGCVAYEERAIPWYERLGDAVHAHDCLQFVQLFACGAQGSGTQYIDDWRPLWAASRIPSAITGEMPEAMSIAQIDELKASFATSAEHVRRAGLDGIEIHAAHSQLLGEFLSPAFNHRDDDYGGDPVKRCRIVLEVGQAIRDAVGGDLALGVRLSFDEFLGEAGITPAQSETQIGVLADSGLFDFFDISGGGYHNLHVAVAPMGTVPEGFLADSAARARAVIGDRARVFVVGRYLDLDTAEATLAAGAADMVAMTRAHMADAHIVNKSTGLNPEPVNRCIGANVCVARLIENREVTCVQNPAMGREQAWGEDAAPAPVTNGERVTVVGAGPAGLRFAASAAARGYTVRVLEAAAEPGGRLNVIKMLPSRGAWQQGIDNLVARAEHHGVAIELGRTATPADLDADRVVLATGAHWSAHGYSPYRPERSGIPGADGSGVMAIDRAIAAFNTAPDALGQRVLIVDECGDYLPLGLAEALARAGVAVDVISPRPLIGSDTQRTLDMPHVLPRLKQLGVVMRPQHFVERIEDGAAWLYDIWGGEPEALSNIDSVVLAMTREPDERLVVACRDAGVAAVAVGDVVAPRRLEAVIVEAEQAARRL